MLYEVITALEGGSLNVHKGNAVLYVRAERSRHAGNLGNVPVVDPRYHHGSYNFV